MGNCSHEIKASCYLINLPLSWIQLGFREKSFFNGLPKLEIWLPILYMWNTSQIDILQTVGYWKVTIFNHMQLLVLVCCWKVTIFHHMQLLVLVCFNFSNSFYFFIFYFFFVIAVVYFLHLVVINMLLAVSGRIRIDILFLLETFFQEITIEVSPNRYYNLTQNDI